MLKTRDIVLATIKEWVGTRRSPWWMAGFDCPPAGDDWLVEVHKTARESYCVQDKVFQLTASG